MLPSKKNNNKITKQNDFYMENIIFISCFFVTYLLKYLRDY
jgi:hypothetical protein